MTRTLERLEEEVSSLCAEGERILGLASQMAALETDFSAEGSATQDRLAEEIRRRYHTWYSSAQVLVDQNLPERAEEFSRLHQGTGWKRGDSRTGNDAWDPGASWYLKDLSAARYFREMHDFRSYVDAQIAILGSIPRSARLRQLTIKELLAADLMRDEIEECKHLLDRGFVRAAGSIAGVVLERHLKLMCEKRNMRLGKKETIGSLNEKLKERYDEPHDYSRVRWMAELRASCGHEKEVEPDVKVVSELISGVHKFVSTVS